MSASGRVANDRMQGKGMRDEKTRGAGENYDQNFSAKLELEGGFPAF